jgi:uncharacterized protein (DUF2267 family)
MDAGEFCEEVGQRLRLQDPQGARRVARVVLLGYHIQLPEDAAKQAEKQLSKSLRELWAHEKEDLKLERGSSTSFSRQQFIQYVADHLGGIDPARAEEAIRVVSEMLRREAPAMDAAVRRELSEGIRELWAGQGQEARAR